MSQNKPITVRNLSSLVAVDDGSSYSKLAWWEADENGKLTIVHNRIAVGIHAGVKYAQLGPGKGKVEVYQVDDQTFTIDPASNGVDTRTDTYQYSAGIVAMSQYALTKSGFAGRDVHIATGIPVKSFFSGADGQTNTKLISQKRDAYVDAVIKNAPDERGNIVDNNPEIEAKVLSNKVLPEAFGAWIDMFLNNDGTENDDDPLFQGDVLIIDMGSNTTDISLVNPQGLIDNQYIRTLFNSGFLKIYDDFKREAIGQGIYGADEFNNPLIEKAIGTGELKLLTRTIDASGIVEKVVKDNVPLVVEKIRTMLGAKIESLSGIIAVGGGANFVKEFFGEELGAAITIPENPQCANSAGFLKALTFWPDDNVDVIDDLSVKMKSMG